jgi:hypothetical protein
MKSSILHSKLLAYFKELILSKALEPKLALEIISYYHKENFKIEFLADIF